MGAGVGELGGRGGSEIFGSRGLALEQGFGFPGPPRTVGDAAQRETNVSNDVAVEGATKVP